MIQPITMYEAECDNCGEQYVTYDGICAYHEAEQMKERLMEAEWHTDGDKHYCPECWSLNDNDEVVIKPKPQSPNKPNMDTPYDNSKRSIFIDDAIRRFRHSTDDLFLFQGISDKLILNEIKDTYLLFKCNKILFDGYQLDKLKGIFVINNKESLDDLISTLQQIRKGCF
jgi:hypothetical protein